MRLTGNARRANNAEVALQAYMQHTGCDGEVAVSDLLADLMHWCDERGLRFDREVDRAENHYEQELIMEDGD